MEMPGASEPTILYVDDQPSHRVLFQKAFRADWLVLTASSAEEGVEILKQHDIFLVIADHSMPGRSGIDFLEEVRRVSPQAVRAILSAYADPGLIKEACARAAVARYFRKPWKRDEIRKFIEASFQQYHFAPTEPATTSEHPVMTTPRICGLLETLEPLPGSRERRRILLNYVQPSLKETVALIVRPCSGALKEAQRAALTGNLREMEKALVAYLKEQPAGNDEPPALAKH